MKTFFKKTIGFMVVFSLIVLATALVACQNPFASNEKEEGSFVIAIGASGNSRAVINYPPKGIPGVTGGEEAPETKDLKYTATFTPIPSGTPKTFEVQGAQDIKGTLALGDYIVTIGVKWDTDLYARGCAIENPVKISSGNNTVNVWVFSVDDAEMPIISEKPHGAAYAVNATAAALKVTAIVNDGGELSYQWYSNTVPPDSGNTHLGETPPDSTLISNATSDSYTPPTTTGGTTYYYVEVTNTNGDNETTITSGPAMVVVNAGSYENPFLVYTVEDLSHVGKPTTGGTYDDWALDKHYKQMADIDLASVVNWTPIGNNSTSSNASRFTGSYDGAGKTISNLKINSPSSDYQGLFGYISGSDAFVENVGLVACNITGKAYVGGVVGYINNGGTVQNCYVTGNVKGTDDYVGGLVGYIINGGTVQNCYATSNVSGVQRVGGVVGRNNSGGMVQSCYATGNVSATNWLAGGVVGSNLGGTMQNCYATSNVSGTQRVGGVTGFNSGTVQNCYATGNVEGTDLSVGGVVGYNEMDNSSNKLQNCAALNPNVTGSNAVGRVTHNSGGTLPNNYGRSDMKKNNGAGSWTNSATGNDGASIDSSNWGSASWWTGTANFDTAVWDIADGSLPKLNNMPGEVQNPVIQ